MSKHLFILPVLALIAAACATSTASTPTQPAPTAAPTTVVAPMPATQSPDATPAGFALASISGYAWHDVCIAEQGGQTASDLVGCVQVQPNAPYQANGLFDNGEPPLAEVKVLLGSGPCPSTGLSETSTAADGSYAFTGLSAGQYCVSVDPQTGLTAPVQIAGGVATPILENNGFDVTLRPGENQINMNFGWDYQLQPNVSGNPGGHGDGPCTYLATFVEDVTVPDDTVIAPGATFTKTWRVRNDGTCTWGPVGYALNGLIFVGGDKLDAPDGVSLPTEVKPGSTVDVSVNLTAPTAPGTYLSEWKFLIANNADASNAPTLGVGANGSAPLYARIVVAAASGNPARITFEAGATSASVEGTLKGGEVKDFVIRTLKAQTMMLDISSLNNDVRLSVRGQDQTPLAASTPATAGILINSLPADGDYVIELFGNAKDTNFSLNITIPHRISFDKGAASATVTGATGGHRSVTYLLQASGGQTLTATLTSPNNNVGLTIYGLSDGQPLVRAVSEARSWTGTLPATQDYVIVAVPAVDSTNFTLQVTVK